MVNSNKFISLQFGRHTLAEFNASILQTEDAQHKTYYRVAENGRPMASTGTIYVDEENAKAGFLYDIMEVIMDIKEKTEIGDNIHYKCATDFGRVDIYICNPDDWKKDGEQIFVKKA